MWEVDLLAAVRAIEKSMAYVMYRLMICFGAALGYLLATLAGAGTLVGFGSLAKNALALGPLGALVGFGLFAYLMFKMRPTWLSAVNVPQLALLADQIKRVPLPTGKALIDFAKRRQAECFPSPPRLFQLDEAIRETQRDMAYLHPCPKLPRDQPALNNAAIRTVRWLSGLNHQTLLAWHFYKGSDNPWLTAADGLAVHERHFGGMTKNRLVVTVFSWVGFALAYPLLLGGIHLLIEDIPINFSFWPQVFAGVFAWAIKAAFFDAIAEAAMMAFFFPLAEKEAGQPVSDALRQHSTAFQQIEQKSGHYLE